MVHTLNFDVIFDAFALLTEQNIETNYSEVMGHLLSVES